MLGLFKKKAPEAPKKDDSAKKTRPVDNSTPAKKKPAKKEFSDFIYTPAEIYDGIGDDVYEEDFVSFIQEPENEHDSNAVKVMWKRSKVQLGYLYKGRTQNLINNALDNGWKISAKIDFMNDPEKTDKAKWICITGSVTIPEE